MTDTDRELSLQDEDRLPWLESVDHDDDDESVTNTKVLGFVLAAILGLGLLIGGYLWLNSQKGPQGDGTLIAAQEGDYKVKPNDPGGMKVEGQGDSAFAASEGAEANGKVDMSAKPEAPVAVVKEAIKPAMAPVISKNGSVMAPMAPVAGTLAAGPLPTAGGGVVQLGAFNSQASADQAWGELVAKTPALARLAKSVAAASVNGRTVYRLRANAGTPAAAAAVCNSVSNCMVVR